MDVKILNSRNLFFEPVRYEIPLYQRRYVWKKRDQWAPLWEDVQNIVDRFLEKGMSTTPHFLGAVVIQRQNPNSDLTEWLVVDGQQRLTTMQLLLDAVQEVFEQRDHASNAARVEKYVLNDDDFLGNQPDRAFKVWPTREDQDAFRHTMYNHLPRDEYKEELIVRAHDFFKEQIEGWLAQDADIPEKMRADALERVITQFLQMVVIDLDANEEPHVIFETLNARGTRLLQSELVKNMLMHEASKANSNYVAHIWDFDGDWWRQEYQQGRLIRPRSDAFLNYWLVMRKQEEVTHTDVFSKFRRYFSNEGNSNVQAVATDLHDVGRAFVKLTEADMPEMETFLYRLGVIQAGVLTPVLMWLVSSEVPAEQLHKSIRTLESFLVRRMVCRMNTGDYNRLFLGLIGRLEKAGAAKAGDTIVEYLSAQNATSRKWPDNRDLEKAFTNLRLYKLLTRGRLRIVLEGIEEELRTDRAETQSPPRNLTIEHIMPQGWRQSWRLPSSIMDRTQAEKDRDDIIHTMGNLTLVNKRLNSSLSNDPWSRKRRTLNAHTTLFLNKTLLDGAPNPWDEDVIVARSRQLAQVAIKVWPHANGI